MLHVLLVILKIIGIILAVLLGLLLLILLLLLFVPIRYIGRICKEKEPEADARLSWLLHIISVPVTFRDGTLSVKVKLFGITVKKLMEDEEELEKDAEEALHDVGDVVSKVEEEIVEAEEPQDSSADISVEEISDHTNPEREPKRAAVREVAEEEKDPKDETELYPEKEDEESPELKMPEQQEDSGPVKKIFLKTRSFFLKIFGIWKKIKNLKYTLRRFCGKIKEGIQKYRNTKEFLLDERTKGALKHCLSQVIVLIRKLLPKKLKGELRFGMEDPALTGEILGGISIFYPIFMDNVKVYPDFHQSILEGELFVKGRFRLVTAVLILWRLWRDKNIRYVYHRFRHRE